ncbi:polyhydroxybutyrate depolymerase [Caulobacter sp. BE264]|uniref:alpha/beta hydrolase family esterase n=1 Tax=Caulobacter sp. BE264 TaxID=2817724 RepID=UPI0028623CF7|nr:PHB depolymerase family esterase [Caulobacter sp. BE264]MDR7231054.1 polyhydroxybutyrate depolymerase [Caulobacter sp. BE264]
MTAGAFKRGFVALLAVLAGLGGAATAHAACAVGSPGATVSVDAGATGRPFLLRRPAGLAADQPAPLLILLHGSGGDGARMLAASRLEATAEGHGFLVAAPTAAISAGKGFAWNIPGVPTVTGKIPDASDADDVAYLAALVDGLVAAGCVEPARVYVTGLSGGGRMASWLGCVASDRYAAIAPVVGLRAGNPRREKPDEPDPATCQPARPMPVIAFAGDTDTTNPTQGGGAGYWQYTMHAAEQRWAALNGCQAPPTTQWVAPSVYEERYSGCRSDADVVGRMTVGGGHTWLADNDALWAFLSRYRREGR